MEFVKLMFETKSNPLVEVLCVIIMAISFVGINYLITLSATIPERKDAKNKVANQNLILFSETFNLTPKRCSPIADSLDTTADCIALDKSNNLLLLKCFTTVEDMPKKTCIYLIE